MNTKAIFTLVLGEEYERHWETYARPSWEEYGRRHGYDIIPVNKPIRELHPLSVRPPHWQKCFVLSHPDAGRYEDVVFLDSDIMINYHRAPCIVKANEPGKIGCVRFDRYLDDDLNAWIVGVRKSQFMNYAGRKAVRDKDPRPALLPDVDFSKVYREYTPDNRDLPRINSGVLVFKPRLHREFLESVYFDSFKDAKDEWVNGVEIDIDQSYLSYRMIRAGLSNLLDERFNIIASFEHAIHYPFAYMVGDETLHRMCWSTMLANSYFLHFARCGQMMRYAAINDDGDFAIVGLKNVFAGDKVTVKHRRS